MSAELGTIEADEGRFRLTLVRRFAARIEAVWAALTRPEELAEWFADVDYEPRPGAEIRMSFGDDADDESYGIVERFDPPHVFEFTMWDRSDEHDRSVVRFELEVSGNETVLTLTHSRQSKRVARTTAAGWHASLDLLIAHVEGRRTTWAECYAPAVERYASLLREKLG